MASCFTLPLELVIRFEHVLHTPTSSFHLLSIARDFIQCSVNLFFVLSQVYRTLVGLIILIDSSMCLCPPPPCRRWEDSSFPFPWFCPGPSSGVCAPAPAVMRECAFAGCLGRVVSPPTPLPPSPAVGQCEPRPEGLGPEMAGGTPPQAGPGTSPCACGRLPPPPHICFIVYHFLVVSL